MRIRRNLASTYLAKLLVVSFLSASIIGGAMYVSYTSGGQSSNGIIGMKGGKFTVTSLPTTCQTSYKTGAPVGTILNVSMTSTAYLCLKFFYYNTSATMTVSPLDQLAVLGQETVAGTNSSTMYDATSLFTIDTNSYSYQIGGPSSVSEGLIIVFSITPTPHTPSGEYFVGFNAMTYPQLENCPTQLSLVVGNPQDYVPGGSTCLNLQGIISRLPPSVQTMYQLNAFGFLDGFLFDEVVGTTD